MTYGYTTPRASPTTRSVSTSSPSSGWAGGSSLRCASTIPKGSSTSCPTFGARVSARSVATSTSWNSESIRSEEWRSEERARRRRLTRHIESANSVPVIRDTPRIDDRDGEDVVVSVAWFPSGEYEEAIRRWPSLAEDWADVAHSDYCTRLDGNIKWMRGQGVPIRARARSDRRRAAGSPPPARRRCRARDHGPAREWAPAGQSLHCSAAPHAATVLGCSPWCCQAAAMTASQRGHLRVMVIALSWSLVAGCARLRVGVLALGVRVIAVMCRD
jgi:hypothetical protein